MRMSSRISLVIGLATVALGVTALPADAVTHHTIRVHAGTGTLSAAVAKAKPGDTLKLDKGTFLDSVVVTIPLTIRGAGWNKTTIMPPTDTSHGCNAMGLNGICIFGQLDSNFNAVTSNPVRNVTVEDLRVTGFSTGIGIVGVNTKRMHVDHVRADHNGGYGVARFQSTDSLFEENWASYNGEAGLYMGDSPNANSVLRENKADHNGFGLFLRDSTDLRAYNNEVWQNCVGIMALNSGPGAAPGDLPASNYKIINNNVHDNDAACPGGDGPPTSGIGIGLIGLANSLVQGNDVTNNVPSGPSAASGGIVLFSTKAQGGADAAGNTVRDNELSGNHPDIFWDGLGSGNTVVKNECATAIPGNLGWCTGNND